MPSQGHLIILINFCRSHLYAIMHKSPFSASWSSEEKLERIFLKHNQLYALKMADEREFVSLVGISASVQTLTDVSDGSVHFSP